MARKASGRQKLAPLILLKGSHSEELDAEYQK